MLPRRRPLANLFCRHFKQIVSRSRGTFGLSRDGGTGSSLITINRVSIGEAPLSGGRPVSNSYSVAPGIDVGGRANLLGPARGLLRGHVVGRPDSAPVRVKLLSPSTCLARPKSVILGVSRPTGSPWPCSKILAGFKSRWMMPRLVCRVDGPDRSVSSAAARGRQRRAGELSARLPPSTSSREK